MREEEEELRYREGRNGEGLINRVNEGRGKGEISERGDEGEGMNREEV